MADRTGTTYNLSGEGIHGFLSQFLVGDGASPEVFQAVAGVKTIKFGEMSNADIKTTHLRSQNRHHEHRSGLRDSGPFEITGIWLPEDESQSNTGGGSGSFTGGGLAAMAADGANRNFQIIVVQPDATTVEWEFEGYVAKFQPDEANEEGIIMFSCSVQPTGAYDAGLP